MSVCHSICAPEYPALYWILEQSFEDNSHLMLTVHEQYEYMNMYACCAILIMTDVKTTIVAPVTICCHDEW